MCVYYIGGPGFDFSCLGGDDRLTSRVNLAGNHEKVIERVVWIYVALNARKLSSVRPNFSCRRQNDARNKLLQKNSFGDAWRVC